MRTETSRKHYMTDVAMRMIWLHMLQDLRDRCDCGDVLVLLRQTTIPEVRKQVESRKRDYSCSPAQFRSFAQAMDFCKRYRFSDDLFSDDELASETWQKFRQTQERCSVPFDPGPLYRAGLVSKWRHLCKEILGPYDPTEWMRYAKFAKKAAVGHPSRRRRLDQKLAGYVTGSPGHLELFSKYLEEDQHLRLALTSKKFKVVTSLKLTFVPKSYKSLRAIMPDTLAGGFYNSGLGRVIRHRLDRIGLPITRLQARHRGLAMRASRVKAVPTARRPATIDLTSASDSVTPQLLRLVLPTAWYKAVMAGRIPYYTFEGNRYRLSSACTMGLGHTFPLQTLLFYVLTMGVKSFTQDGLVSVYGDDIIAPSGCVEPLRHVFRHVHLLLNMDKSFWGLCDFRESCGEDFYRGISVRPAMPDGSSRALPKREFLAFLYSVANTIFSRWDVCELPETSRIITCMIRCLAGHVRRVPKHFPSDSGIQYDIPEARMQYETRDWVTRVTCETSVPGKSRVINEAAYLWEWFRTAAFLDSVKEFKEALDTGRPKSLRSLLIGTLRTGQTSMPTTPCRPPGGRNKRFVPLAVDPARSSTRVTHASVAVWRD